MPWKIQGGGPTPWGEEQITTGWSAPDWDAEVGAFRKSSGGLGIDYYLEEIFDSAPIGHPERLPKKVFWNRNGKKPPTDCMAFFSHFIVSSRVRDLIEELEPRVHEFFQIELFNMKSEERWPEPYWFLHIRNVLDSVIDELSEINRINTRGRWSPSVSSDAGQWSPKGRRSLVLHASEIHGKHVWRDVGNLTQTFGSDDFVKELQAREIKGIGAPKHYGMR